MTENGEFLELNGEHLRALVAKNAELSEIPCPAAGPFLSTVCDATEEMASQFFSFRQSDSRRFVQPAHRTQHLFSGEFGFPYGGKQAEDR